MRNKEQVMNLQTRISRQKASAAARRLRFNLMREYIYKMDLILSGSIVLLVTLLYFFLLPSTCLCLCRV